MSNVTVNKVGMDIVDVEVRSKGSPSTDMFFQDPILDFTRDYVIGVSELVIPLNSEPMLSGNPQNDILFQVRIRDPGMDATDPHSYPVEAGKYKLSDWDTNTAAEFYKSLLRFSINWSGQFGQHIDQALGLMNPREFKIVVHAGGRVNFVGNAEFWIHHFIELSNYGMEVLGTGTRYIHSTLPLAGGPVTREAGDLTVGGLSARGNIQGTFETQDIVQLRVLRQTRELVSPRASLSTLEHRLRIELDADLSVAANILMENNSQKVHYNIASFAFPTSVTQELDTIRGGVEDVKFVTKLLTGKYVVKAKQTPTTDWYRLLATANVQNMRLHVFIVRREYNEATASWHLVRNELTIRAQDVWDATLKFVQTF